MSLKLKSDFTIRTKLVLIFTFTSVIVFGVNLYMYSNINSDLKVIENVYLSNRRLNELGDVLGEVQDSMYEYLNTKSSAALEEYYRSGQEFSSYLDDMNGAASEDYASLMEKNIRNMSLEYLQEADTAVTAKRGRNIEKYKESYENATDTYQYISTYIYSLNNEQFRNNSNNYEILLVSLKYLEIITTMILFVITALNIILIMFFTNSITTPLRRLAKAADEVAGGNLNVLLADTQYNDEVGVVSKAFNKMTVSIREYIAKLKESMESESRAKEKELVMETHLKDAQLKYLQAQINPHFLFNTLNAGVQLAMMEEAENTGIFIEKMAEFFRYNIKKISEDASLREEIELVESYIYIMNVRFSGEIDFRKEIDESLLEARIPSMVLQPIVENAVSYGIRGIEWAGLINLSVSSTESGVLIRIQDNGRGMTKETIAKVMNGELKKEDSDKNSNGIGLGNVISRLKLYFGTEDVFEIRSGGTDHGTEVLISIPASGISGFSEADRRIEQVSK